MEQLWYVETHKPRFNHVTRALECPERGAAAHMSLHLTYNEKEPKTIPRPSQHPCQNNPKRPIRIPPNPEPVSPNPSERPAYMDHLSCGQQGFTLRSEEHTYELQSLMRISYAVFC